jgi:hypothetical protein
MNMPHISLRSLLGSGHPKKLDLSKYVQRSALDERKRAAAIEAVLQ